LFRLFRVGGGVERVQPGWAPGKLLTAEVDVAVGEDVGGSQAADHLDCIVAESV